MGGAVTTEEKLNILESIKRLLKEAIQSEIETLIGGSAYNDINQLYIRLTIFLERREAWTSLEEIEDDKFFNA